MPLGTVVLHGLERSVYTRIARLALEEKRVPYTLEAVEIFGPEGVPARHLERHPFGRIPVLRHGDFTLYETAAITRYVDDAFEGPPLQPAGAAPRARMNQLIGLLDAYAYRPMVWGVFVQCVRLPQQGRATDPDEVARSLAAAAVVLRVLEDALHGTDHLAGPALTLADLHAWPMLRYFSLAAEGEALLRRFPGTAGWLHRLQPRPSIQGTLSQFERA